MKQFGIEPNEGTILFSEFSSGGNMAILYRRWTKRPSVRTFEIARTMPDWQHSVVIQHDADDGPPQGRVLPDENYAIVYGRYECWMSYVFDEKAQLARLHDTIGAQSAHWKKVQEPKL
jgi:hypothetical protein